MTYVPVTDDTRKGAGGRPSLDIPEALLSQLRHSRATGARCEVQIGPDDADELAELKRLLIRAGYRHFPDHSIFRRMDGDTFRFWVGPKVQRKRKETPK